MKYMNSSPNLKAEAFKNNPYYLNKFYLFIDILTFFSIGPIGLKLREPW